MDRLITESGDVFVQETVQGIVGASSLNDTRIETINLESFSTSPTPRGWLYGNGWQWDSLNLNMKPL